VLIEAVSSPKPATFVDLPDVLVNLSNTGGDRTQYLKVKIVLELPDATLVPQIQPLMPRVMDAFQTYLRELRPTDLDGSAGLYRLKEELTRRVNAAVAPNRITAVLFKEIVVQ
jgi:flagellar FliL protein